MSLTDHFQPEFLETDLTEWKIGPYDSSLPGPVKLHLTLDGEVISGCRIERGYLHRGLEKVFEKCNWTNAVPYASRLDPENAIFGELAYCLAVEKVGQIEVPPRAQRIRVIVSELTRVSNHLAYVVRLGQSVQSETIIHYVMREREKILDLFELLVGARFSLNLCRVGGVSVDISEGFLERVQEVCDLVRVRIKEYNDLFSFNHAFLKRACYSGIIYKDQAEKFLISGPNARASGLLVDVRKNFPYSGYGLFDFNLPIGKGEFGIRGDAHDRFLLRLREISQSLEIILQASEGLPTGDHWNRIDDYYLKPIVPEGQAYVRVESPKGCLGCFVVSDGRDRPFRVQFRAPSINSLGMVPELLIGYRVGDIPLTLASLDISMAEVDR